VGIRGNHPVFALGGAPEGVATAHGALSTSGNQLVYMPNGIIMNISPAGVAVQYVPHSYLPPGAMSDVMQPVAPGAMNMGGAMPPCAMPVAPPPGMGMMMQIPPPSSMAVIGQSPMQGPACATIPEARSDALQGLALAAAQCS